MSDMLAGGSVSARAGFALIGVVVVLGVVGCSGDDRSATVLVDYTHDEFATQFIKYFPDHVRVHPGDVITFKQAWTGEPHTVTLGTRVDDLLDVTRALVEEYAHLPEEEVPMEVFEAFCAAEESLPTFYPCMPEEEVDAPEGDDSAAATPPEEELNQTIAQPCLVVDGEVPQDGRPCEVQDLPPFQGTELYYNSGIIPFEGPQGNVFEFELSDTIEPGSYSFYCAIHGSFQAGIIEVVEPDEPAQTPEEINAVTRDEINDVVEPFRETFAQATTGRYVFGGETHTGNFSGLLDERVEGLLNEFVPETIETTVGEPVSWVMFGPHSISFDVPEYFPIVEFDDDGTVRLNEDLYPPAGGAPEVPEPEGPERITVDAGTYDGSGFWSSGVFYSEGNIEYTLRFSKPGTYRYACLIHPPMVGTVNVKG
jgi:plastocyanin